MSMTRTFRRAVSRAIRAVADGFHPAPPPPEQTLFPGDPRRLVERTLNTPPGGPWDGFRSTSWTQRDLAPLDHDLMLAGAQWLWASSPIAKRCLEIQRDFVVSEGWEPKATCEDPQDQEDVQEVLDAFWQDEVFDWRLEIRNLAREVALSGELTLHHSDNPHDGTVHVGLVNPEGISQIEPNPLNASELVNVILKQQVQTGLHDDGTPVMQDKFPIVRRCRDLQSPQYGQLVGDVFHLRINGLSNASRGLSDLMPVIDWLDQIHQLAHSEVDRAMLLKAFCWDVVIKGDQKAVEEARKRNQEPPPPGSVNFHTESETWSPQAPNLEHADMLELLKFIQGWICACLGVPEHYLYEANTVNKASAAEMDDPVYARVRERQSVLRAFCRRILQYVLERAYLCRRPLRDGRPFQVPPHRATFEIETVDPDRKAYPEVTGALSTLVDALSRAKAEGFLTPLEAANTCRKVANSLLDLALEDLDESTLPPGTAQQGPGDPDGISPEVYAAGRDRSLRAAMGMP